jgi:inosine-uridine nucleoside N-ribohydrolase
MQDHSTKTIGISAPILILATALLLAGCVSQSIAPDPEVVQLQDPKPVVFDTDMAHDDMFAALFLMAHPNVDVRAITVVGTGEAHCGPGVANALGLVALAGQSGIPVACGRETPLEGNHTFPAAWRQGADEAYGVSIPDGGDASPLAAPDLIAETIRSMDEKISIVAVGPLTNIAEAIQKYPENNAKIETIYIMGGAINVPGNVGPSGVGIQNEFAEWNIYIDPAAANIVFASGIPVTLVPLDATREVPVTRAFYRALGDHSNTPPAKLVHEILTANLDFVDSGGFQFWDSLTAAIFTDESLTTFEEMQLIVMDEEGPESGYTKPAPEGGNIRVATHADKEEFEKLFLTILNWNPIP